MDVASEVIELFSTRDSHRATELAAKLERLNRERRDVEAAALTIIEARLAADAELAADRLLVIDGDGWHRGVIGILASRVVERTAKPAIVVSVEDGSRPRLRPLRRRIPASRRHRNLRRSLHALRRPRLRRRLRAARRSTSRTQAPPAHLRRASTSPRASPSACCAFTPSCRSTASRRCSPDGCASSSRSATAIPSRSSSRATRACSPRRAS